MEINTKDLVYPKGSSALNHTYRYQSLKAINDNEDLDSKENCSILNHKYRYQLLAAVTVQLITFANGIATGWISPTLHKLQSVDSPTNFIVTVKEVSWIGSLFGLGSLAGNILFGLLLNRIGRKWCLNLIAVPYIISWILIYFSKTYIYLCVARFLGGMTGGGNYVVMPIFISEIADPRIRGALSSMAMMFLSLGILAGFVLSSHLDYYRNPCVILLVPITYLLAVKKLPETPQYLLRTQQIVQAGAAFKFYKNMSKCKQTEASKAKQEELEFEELKQNLLKNNDQLEKLEIKDFVNPEALKAFLTAFMLMFLNQFSGSFAFSNYMSDIFAQTGTDMNPNTCTIIMGVVQMSGTLLTMTLVDRFGRKMLMLISSAGMAVGLFVFNIYIQFTTQEQKLHYNWLPLIIMTFVVLVASIGIISLVFTIIVEILPTKIRAVGSSICMATMSCMVFVSLKIFPLLLHNYGLATILFACGAVCVLCWFYMLIFLKETKGKSLDK